MTQQEIIADIESRARRVGVTIRSLCGMADVHPTTFSRWKRSARNPRPVPATMDRLENLWRALERLEAKRAEQDAA